MCLQTSDLTNKGSPLRSSPRTVDRFSSTLAIAFVVLALIFGLFSLFEKKGSILTKITNGLKSKVGSFILNLPITYVLITFLPLSVSIILNLARARQESFSEWYSTTLAALAAIGIFVAILGFVLSFQVEKRLEKFKPRIGVFFKDVKLKNFNRRLNPSGFFI
jgi:amino acid permease